MKSDHALPLSALFTLSRATTINAPHNGLKTNALSSVDSTTVPASNAAAFHIASRRRNGRWNVRLPPTATDWRSPLLPIGGWWAAPREAAGDAPDKYHPCYAMAILSSRMPRDPLFPAPRFERQDDLVRLPTAQAFPATLPPPHEYSCNTKPVPTKRLSIKHWRVPEIPFSTAPDVRRSMTLNGMRMTIEYTQTGSGRVLQLIESRLEAGQRDIVHDVLVYLMRQILDARQNQSEARDNRAQSVAAYLGLDETGVCTLFASSRLSASAIARRIDEGKAGPRRRNLQVEPLLRGQLSLLRSDLRGLEHKEATLLWLLDEIVIRLSADDESIQR